MFFSHSLKIFSQDLTWYQSNGPYGGYFTSIVSLGSDTLVVADSFKGFHRSTDSGNSWEYVPFSIGYYLTFSDMLVNNNNMIVASSIYSDDIYTSYDGINWDVTQDVFLMGGPRDLVLDDIGNIYGCSMGIVYKSTDGGFTWSSITANNLPYTTLESIIVTDSNDIFVAMHTQGVAVLRYGNNSWEIINDGLQNLSCRSFALDENGTLYLGTLAGIYKLESDSTNWIKTINVLQDKNVLDLFYISTGVMLASSNGIYRSDNYGESWSIVKAMSQVSSFTRDEADHIFASTDGEILTSNDFGLNWFEIYNGIISTDVRTMITDGNNVYAGTYGNGIYKGTNEGASWTKVNDGLTSFYVNDFIIDNNIVYTATNRGIFISSNAGTNWTETGFSQFNTGSMSISLTESDEIYTGTWSDGVYKTDIENFDWTKVIEIPDNQIIWSVLSKDSCILIGGYGIYYSPDLGINWARVDSFDNEIYSLAVTDAGSYIAGSNGKLYKSEDQGESWRLVFSETSDYFKDIIVNDSTIFAASRGQGVFVSIDDGENWQVSSDGLLSEDVISLCADNKNTIYAGTFRYGIFSTNEVSNVEYIPSPIPQNYLLDNYPNPFNPTTKISFAISKSSNITLTVYDALGSKVSTLIDDFIEAGNYSVSFDASDLASGIYFYRLTSDTFSETKKMVLLR